MRGGVLNFQLDRRDDHGDRVPRILGLVSRHRFCGLAERKAGDIGDGAHRLVGPMRVHPGAGVDGGRAGGSHINGVHQQGVGAVELDQRPGERPVQGLAG
ncbi:Uncharacterised protein [Mycobacterium tuberculosis]|nr:Uncharacterised protein [Mycobacterium tuberculosis]